MRSQLPAAIGEKPEAGRRHFELAILYSKGRDLMAKVGDSAYAGQKDKLTKHAPKAKDFTRKKACRNRRLTGQEPSVNREPMPEQSMYKDLAIVNFC